DGTAGSATALTATMAYQLPSGERIRTRLNEKEMDLVRRGWARGVVQNGDGSPLLTPFPPDENSWRTTDSSLKHVQDVYMPRLLQQIVSLALREPGRVHTFVDWGCGKGQTLKDIHEQLVKHGISNVRLIGFSNWHYDEWESMPPGISFILDTPEALANYF